MSKTDLTAIRETHVPKGAVKVEHKASSAVAYLYTQNGRPCVRLFSGRAQKPVLALYFVDGDNLPATQAREKRIADFFAETQRKEDAKAAEKKAGHTFQVGDILYTSWGWEQTNIDFFQVVGVTAASVKMCAIGQEKAEDQYMQGTCTPIKDKFIGETFTARASGQYTKAEGHYANKWDGKPKRWTAYA